jgi:hypothetical protein
MQIVHTIQCSDTEIEAVFEPARLAGEIENSLGYEAAERPVLIAQAVSKFKDVFEVLIKEAFDYGYRVGFNSANTKDTEMYK